MSGMNDIDARLIDEFIDALWLADGLAKNTLAGYRSDLAIVRHSG
jgi:integrase/recombinase XerD